jgi:PAS domain S-box-containing protein
MASEVELRQYAQLVNSAADPAFICDGEGRLRLVNPALLAATGYEAEELLRHPAAMLFTAGTLPLPASKRPESIYETGWSGEVAWRRRDGSEFPAYLALRPVPSDLLARPGLVGTAHDLAEHKRHEATLLRAYEEVAAARRALEELNAQLEAKVVEKTASLSDAYARLAAQHEALQTLDELKSEFVSLVSHELRAPLTNISGGIELVLSAPDALAPRTHRSLTLVQAEIQRLTHFVETILDLSALEAGRLPLYPAPLDVRPMLEGVLQQFEARPGAERLCLSVPDGLPAGQADERAYASVIFQLVDNALKYAAAGPVSVTAAAGARGLEVTVSDQGPGIPTAQLDKVFDRFERLNDADNRDEYGHGLGLYMARRLLEAQGGGIAVSNNPQGGASFTFWIPTVEAEDGDQNPAG